MVQGRFLTFLFHVNAFISWHILLTYFSISWIRPSKFLSVFMVILLKCVYVFSLYYFTLLQLFFYYLFFSDPYFTLIFLAVFISYLFFFYIFISQQSLRVFPFSHVLLLLFCSYDFHEHWHSYIYFPMSVFYFITYVADCCNICVAHDWAISCAMFTDLFNLYIVFVSPAKCCLVI